MSADGARMKLVRALGEERATQLIAEVLAERSIPDLTSPNHRYTFAAALIERGGVFEAIGRAIRVQALLQGASGPERSS
jgi:hypothetical protein